MKIPHNTTTLFFCIFFLILGCTAASKEKPAVRDVSVKITVPDMGWKISIEEVYRVGDEILVIAALSRKPGMAAQMITAISDTVTLAADPSLPVQSFVTGKTWNWDGDESCVFINSKNEIRDKLKGGTQLYKKGGL